MPKRLKLNTHHSVRYHSLHKTTMKCSLRSQCYTPDRWSLPAHNALHHNPFSVAVGHDTLEHSRYFGRKLTLTCSHDAIRPTRRVVTTTDPRIPRKNRCYDLFVCTVFITDC